MLLQLSQLNLSNTHDTWNYTLDPSFLFSVASFRRHVESSCLSSSLDPIRWNKHLHIKVNIHVWRLCLDRLSTRVNLDKKGIDLDSVRCPGSKCKTLYWVDPKLPSVYYKQEVFKLLQKVNLHQTKMNDDKCRMREMERGFDFQKSTLEKQVLALQIELKESEASVGQDHAPTLPNWNAFALFEILSDLHLLLSQFPASQLQWHPQ
nr:RNA-directed DNA polymerase, eukaryota, reverse transcriptase zinc-binding domain protein [Tanacetum cinerariifolium]